ncbi:HAD-like domain-containing protein [Nemania sp. NC0429]|nr:HAD-like domain-containing protein [Nemania sp. NC0429]
MRRLCLSSISRVQNHSRKRISSATITTSTSFTTITTTASIHTTSSANAAATTASRTAQPPPRRRRATDTAAIMSAADSGYAEYLAYINQNYAAAFNPLAPSFVPPLQGQQPQSQPLSHALPSGQVNVIVPPSLSASSTLPHRLIAPDTAKQNAYATKKSPRSPSPRAAQRDAICQPSPASGGVPDPTPEYLTIASHPPFLLPNPRNLLVVVDLNGTLLHRPSRHSPTRFVERPHARPFLSYCINTFTVVIWSSARPDNVQNMCRQLMTPEDSAKVVAVWGRDSFGLSQADYFQRTQCYKRLTKLWNDPVIAASHPMAANGEKWSQVNTVLVDDSMEKARSEPFNLVQLPEFKGNAKEPGFILPQVHDYLNDCSMQTNVSAYMKGHPFKARPDFTL